jgi:hypothetical protein
VARIGATFRPLTGAVAAESTPFPFIGEHMEKPHIPTIAELEALFAEDTTPMTYRAPPDPARLQTAVRAFISAWDDDLTVRELSPFVEEVRRALEGRP